MSCKCFYLDAERARSLLLAAALETAAAKFEEYGKLHLEKGTSDGVRKAHANFDFAAGLRVVLTLKEQQCFNHLSE